jgi:hypothetical protein
MDEPLTFAGLQALRLRDLLASVRVIVNPLAGITSGPGNQGTSCPASLVGHAGTPATFLGLARSLGGPGIGGATPT